MKLTDILEEQEMEYPHKLKITKSALMKAYLYAALLKEMSGRPLECYGYLTAPIDKYDGIAYGMILSKGQEVTEADCLVDFCSEFETIEEIRRKRHKIVGWWHSHGDYPVFHSKEDNINIEQLSKIIFPHNKIHNKMKRKKILEGPIGVDVTDNIIRIYSQKKAVCLQTDGTPPPKIKDIWLEERLGISYSYSLVVNAKIDAPYGEIRYGSKEVKGKIIEIIDDKINKVSTKTIQKEIKERVKSPLIGIRWREVNRKKVNKILKKVYKRIENIIEESRDPPTDKGAEVKKVYKKDVSGDFRNENKSICDSFYKTFQIIRGYLAEYVTMRRYAENETV